MKRMVKLTDANTDREILVNPEKVAAIKHVLDIVNTCEILFSGGATVNAYGTQVEVADKLMSGRAATGSVDEIDRLRTERDTLRAENERLRAALSEIAYNTSTSVPLGLLPSDFHPHQSRRAISIAANALNPEATS